MNKSVYAALQQQLARTSIHGQDALILTALGVVTSLDANAPTYLDAATETAAKWIDKQTGNYYATTILAKIKAALPALTNFPLTHSWRWWRWPSPANSRSWRPLA